jgi:hypothetical protein
MLITYTSLENAYVGRFMHIARNAELPDQRKLIESLKLERLDKILIVNDD